jgi:hypothetical protein
MVPLVGSRESRCRRWRAIVLHLVFRPPKSRDERYRGYVDAGRPERNETQLQCVNPLGLNSMTPIPRAVPREASRSNMDGATPPPIFSLPP